MMRANSQARQEPTIIGNPCSRSPQAPPSRPASPPAPMPGRPDIAGPREREHPCSHLWAGKPSLPTKKATRTHFTSQSRACWSREL